MQLVIMSWSARNVSIICCDSKWRMSTNPQSAPGKIHAVFCQSCAKVPVVGFLRAYSGAPLYPGSTLARRRFTVKSGHLNPLFNQCFRILFPGNLLLKPSHYGEISQCSLLKTPNFRQLQLLQCCCQIRIFSRVVQYFLIFY